MNYDEMIKNIKFDEKGLVPAVAQDVYTREVLMLAYMNKESLKKTLDEGEVCYYSRSRKELWKKGETSGSIQILKGLSYDCDGDTILLQVEQKGVACHTGEYSCFFNHVIKYNSKNILKKLTGIIKDRKGNPVEGSYTNYLFDKGIDKILKKVGEECSEVIIGAKNRDKDEMTYEISDLVYHIIVLMVNEGLELSDIEKELEKRHK